MLDRARFGFTELDKEAKMIIRKYIRHYEIGLLFKRDEFVRLVLPGRFFHLNLLGRLRLEVYDRRALWFVHDQLDLFAKSGQLADVLRIVDLKDMQRALVWKEGRFHAILGPGRHAYWMGQSEVALEVVEARGIRFMHEELETIVRGPGSDRYLDVQEVPPEQLGVLFLNGQAAGTLSPGRYAFWKHLAPIKLARLEMREAVLDVPGQEILTADKVTLRLNAEALYRVRDPQAAVAVVDDPKQALYREVQLALRTVIGNRELDVLLADKDAVGQELAALVRPRAAHFGLEIAAIGIRDLILPGEMRELFNKVIAAQKAAEANIIARREEAAALRHQTNAAKLLTDHPMLLRLRELETLERVAAHGKLNIVLGEKGLTERVVNLL
jgi:hypothetical protein